MESDFDALGNSENGKQENAAFKNAASLRARAMMDSGEIAGDVMLPLLRAIKKSRLQIPVLSQTVNRVIQIIESPEVDLDELAGVVSQDPGLSAKLMGVANSSYFRGSAEVLNVRDALMRMGMREARKIVIVVSLRSVVLRSPGQGSGATQLWQHSLLTAAVTQEIAAERPPWLSAGFLAGMVHDIGHLVIQAFIAELPAWREEEAPPSQEIVDRLIEGLHAALGAHVLASWGFPDSFCEAILHHHDASQSEGATGDLKRIVDLGNRIAHQIEEGWPDTPDQLSDTLVEFAETLGFSPEMLFDLAIEAEASFAALAKLG